MIQAENCTKIEFFPQKGNLVVFAPVGAPRVRLGYYPGTNKFFLYLGFESQEEAMKLYVWLVERGVTTRYDHSTDSGVNKPRRSEYVSGYAWEIKWHRPTSENMEFFIRLDKERQK